MSLAFGERRKFPLLCLVLLLAGRDFLFLSSAADAPTTAAAHTIRQMVTAGKSKFALLPKE